ncbi:basic secretory protein-like protein [Carboxylicivirga caseinilyticus]|uniref:basic secretory protein-like protein n=1 Tax=Carboxylicivirga caseinilyticus TaxID=3417572 RepID=UPI003D351668|nr:basic secretory family protein [Marinilabiliaceae bacterium A049]
MALRVLFFLILAQLTYACKEEMINLPALYDQNPETAAIGKTGSNELIILSPLQKKPLSYHIYSSGSDPKHDPYKWTLKGSNNGIDWTVIDERAHQYFCARYQERSYTIQNPKRFDQYLIIAETQNRDTLKIGDIELFSGNTVELWKDFAYPAIQFENKAQNTLGSQQYEELVQNPDNFIRYHAQKVAEILFYTDKDTMNDIQKIAYQLSDYNGISAKSGQPPVVSIVFSTQHIEKSANESLFKLNYETRGVLFHELTHAYQFEPSGIGSYSTNKTFWACIEGLADAVRAEAGFFDINKLRKPGGHWLDGYQTTGFFLQWLTTKDPDAIKKFHLTVRDLPIWSFDMAMKQVFGPDSGIEVLWNEYQNFLNKN